MQEQQQQQQQQSPASSPNEQSKPSILQKLRSMLPRSRSSTLEDPSSRARSSSLFSTASTPSKLTPQMVTKLQEYKTSWQAREHISLSPQIKADSWFNKAVTDPEEFANMLLKVAALQQFEKDGTRIISDEEIEQIRALMQPELVLSAVQMRRASHLLQMAASPCFKEYIMGAEGQNTKGRSFASSILRLKSSLVEFDPESPEHIAAKTGLIDKYFSIVEILLTGVDFNNWDNLSWAFPPEMESTDEKTRFILDSSLLAKGVKNNATAMARFPACDSFLRTLNSARPQGAGKRSDKRRSTRRQRSSSKRQRSSSKRKTRKN